MGKTDSLCVDSVTYTYWNRILPETETISVVRLPLLVVVYSIHVLLACISFTSLRIDINDCFVLYFVCLYLLISHSFTELVSVR